MPSELKFIPVLKALQLPPPSQPGKASVRLAVYWDSITLGRLKILDHLGSLSEPGLVALGRR